MTSAAPPHPASQQQQQQQQQRANHPYTQQSPVPAQPQYAASPPNRRDLKSWWKGFKLPSKHQEPHGTEAPSTRPRFYRAASVFVEGTGDCQSKVPSSLLLLQDRVAAQYHSGTHQASASLSQTREARAPERVMLDTIELVLGKT
jgi:GTPase-activating protein SAC7